MKIIYTTKFSREYKKLSLQLKHLAEEREIIFRDDPFDSKLKTHKLKGKFKDFLAFSIDYRHRIIFEISFRHFGAIA
jgi:mRNA-degrading endonuclease YafQ of YafQ-DinJ toxin-antitoxin module